MRKLMFALAVSLAAGCINPDSTNCDLGMFFGGAAGTSRCPPSWRGYQDDPRYSLGIPFTATAPDGSTHIISGSSYRAERAMEPYREALRRIEREERRGR